MRKIATNTSGIWATLMILLPAASLLAQKPTSPAPQSQTVQFSVYFPLANSSQLDQLIANLNTQGSPNYQQWLTPQEFRQQFGELLPGKLDGPPTTEEAA